MKLTVTVSGLMTRTEYLDDDDVNWKVRRAAAKCLKAVIVIVPRHKMIEEFYTTSSPPSSPGSRRGRRTSSGCRVFLVGA